MKNVDERKSTAQAPSILKTQKDHAVPVFLLLLIVKNWQKTFGVKRLLKFTTVPKHDSWKTVDRRITQNNKMDTRQKGEVCSINAWQV